MCQSLSRNDAEIVCVCVCDLVRRVDGIGMSEQFTHAMSETLAHVCEDISWCLECVSGWGYS